MSEDEKKLERGLSHGLASSKLILSITGHFKKHPMLLREDFLMMWEEIFENKKVKRK